MQTVSYDTLSLIGRLVPCRTRIGADTAIIMSSSCTTTILPGNLPSVLLRKAVATVKSLDNILHQMVTHDIAAVKLDDTDTLDTAQRLHRPR